MPAFPVMHRVVLIFIPLFYVMEDTPIRFDRHSHFKCSLSICHTVQPNRTLCKDTPLVVDSEMDYLELSLLYMEHRFNIHSIIRRHLHLIENIFKYLKISLIPLKISSNN